MKKWFLRTLTLLFIIGSAMGIASIVVILKSDAIQNPAHVQAPVLVQVTDIDLNALLVETNKARSESSVNTLALNEKLNQSAQAKCDDMVRRNYWTHNTPDGQEPWTFIQNAGITYAKAGENQSYGFPNSQAVVQGWLKSPSHRKNLLDPTFTQVGFGRCISDNYVNTGRQVIVVQHFIKP